MSHTPFVFPQGPAVKNEDRTLGLVCCPAGQLYAKARIDRSAYCPGEEVKITGHVSNQSSKQVTGTEVQLIQKVVFKAPHGKRRTSLSVFYIPLACPLPTHLTQARRTQRFTWYHRFIVFHSNCLILKEGPVIYSI